MNAYVTEPIIEKVWSILGNEWGAYSGKKASIIRALSGLNSAGRDFCKHVYGCMRHVDYNLCPDDPDMWIKTKFGTDRDIYYSWIFFDVDNILVVHHDSMTMLNKIKKYFKYKPYSIGDTGM